MKSICRGLTFVVAFTCFGASAYSENLFNEAGVQSAQEHSTAVRRKGVLRSRTVRLNPSVLDSQFTATAKPRGNLSVTLFPGVTVEIQPTDFDNEHGPGTVAWSGKVVGQKFSFATFVRQGQRIFGQVQLRDQIFTVTSNENGAHTISQLMPRTDRGDITVTPPGSIRAPKLNSAPEPNEAAPARIRVLFLYTGRAKGSAKAAGTNIHDDARMSIAMANSSLANTVLTGYKFQYLRSMSIGCSYNENRYSYVQLLDDVTNSTTCIGNRAARLRNRYRADLVAVLRTEGGAYCGVAWLNETPNNSNYGFSLTSRDCVAFNVVAHEIGHNVGLQHDRYVTNDSQANFNYGYVDLRARVRSVMAYNNQCADRGFNCTRAPLFSNVHRNGRWQGTRMGRSKNKRNSADNRLKIRQNWPVIAGWR